MIDVGDKVAVLDDDVYGIVLKVSGIDIIIETSDGFEMEYKANELVKTNSELKNQIFSKRSLTEVISEKDSTKKRPKATPKKKEREQPAMEVDLHIHQLIDTTKGMSNHDMLNLQLDTARRQLEFAIKKRIPKIVFIHGVGEGVLKLELEYLFGRYDNVSFYDANYQKYGIGATEVRIFKNKKTS
ncbi:MAG: DNA mismatch repair protein MutS [Bacteroidia bacterium]|nr:DNA mismatch repair protein MutS [Bacteroidia bacterium]NND11611.1 Smr/MutS family protein [Flavobacteriaceae bacterium]